MVVGLLAAACGSWGVTSWRATRGRAVAAAARAEASMALAQGSPRTQELWWGDSSGSAATPRVAVWTGSPVGWPSGPRGCGGGRLRGSGGRWWCRPCTRSWTACARAGWGGPATRRRGRCPLCSSFHRSVVSGDCEGLSLRGCWDPSHGAMRAGVRSSSCRQACCCGRVLATVAPRTPLGRIIHRVADRWRLEPDAHADSLPMCLCPSSPATCSAAQYRHVHTSCPHEASTHLLSIGIPHHAVAL